MNENSDSPQKQQTMVNSIIHALSILRFLARSGESHGVTAIAREVGISPSSAFNIVKTLTAENFLHFSESQKRYTLGPGAMELAGVALDGKKAFERVSESLELVTSRFGVTSGFWRVTDDERLVLIGMVDGKALMRIQMTIGQRIPALSGAMGRCYAAASKWSGEKLRQKFDAVRWQSTPDFERYVEEVALAGERGWAVDSDQYIRGVTTVAAPVFDNNAKPAFFIVNSGFVGQLRPDQIQDLGDLTRQIALQSSALLFRNQSIDREI
jgi:DNA-binding IclR family transcriptional regulator